MKVFALSILVQIIFLTTTHAAAWLCTSNPEGVKEEQIECVVTKTAEIYAHTIAKAEGAVLAAAIVCTQK